MKAKGYKIINMAKKLSGIKTDFGNLDPDTNKSNLISIRENVFEVILKLNVDLDEMDAKGQTELKLGEDHLNRFIDQMQTNIRQEKSKLDSSGYDWKFAWTNVEDTTMEDLEELHTNMIDAVTLVNDSYKASVDEWFEQYLALLAEGMTPDQAKEELSPPQVDPIGDSVIALEKSLGNYLYCKEKLLLD